MACCPQLRLPPAGLLQSLLLLVMGATSIQEENSTEASINIISINSTSVTPNSPGPNVVAIVVPTVILGLLAIAGVAVVVLLRVKKKRQTEGTYRPSSEEQTGASSVQAPDALKLPKEERLI